VILYFANWIRRRNLSAQEQNKKV